MCLRPVEFWSEKKEVLFEDPLERGEWRESGKALLGVVPQSGTDQWEK
jgi:hypothetical protein